MTSFVPIEDSDGNQIYLEIIPTANKSGIKQTSKDAGVVDKLKADDFKKMIRQAVMPTCQTFVDVWQELNQPLMADSAEVEFNLGFTASGNAVIMQASGQASFKVKVSWKFSPSKEFNMSDRKNNDFNFDLESLESEIKTLKESRTSPSLALLESNSFNHNEEIEKTKRKLKNAKLNLIEQLYQSEKNCQYPPCDSTKTPEEGGCCSPQDNRQIIEYLQKIQSFYNEIENL